MISIIIPTYNRSDLITETLDSILNQSEKDWECILVDDGSEDETWNILENYSQKDNRFIIFKRENFDKPKGANACRNIGIEKSKGDYLVFFDSDDLMQSDCIAEHQKMIQNSQPDLSILPSVYFGQNLKETTSVIKGDVYDPDLIEKFFRKEIVWLTHNPAVSKKFLMDHQINFEESLQAAQDWEFFMKILLKHPKISFSEYVGVKMRVHDDTISKNANTTAAKYFHYYKARTIVFNSYLSDSQRKELNKYFKSYARMMLQELMKRGKYDWAKRIIQTESHGLQQKSNLFFLSLYKSTKKGLSKIDLS